jgi:hypothetical protein
MIIFPKIVFLVVFLQTILLSVTLAIDMAEPLFFLMLILVHLGMWLSHISE